MGDVDETTQDDATETDDTEEEATDESETEDESDTSENNDDEESDDESGDDSDDDGAGDSKESDTTDDDAEDEEDDGAEPPTRKPQTNAEWAAKRVAAKKAKKAAQKSDDADDDDSDEDAEDDVDDEDTKLIDARIEKQLAPLKQREAEQEVDNSIAEFVNANPDFKPYAAKAKRYAMHPSRKDVPVKSIFYELAGDKLLSIGAKRKAAADQKAKKGKTGGADASQKGNKSYSDMPLEDFGKELTAEKTKRRD